MTTLSEVHDLGQFNTWTLWSNIDVSFNFDKTRFMIPQILDYFEQGSEISMCNMNTLLFEVIGTVPSTMRQQGSAIYQ